MLRRLKIAVSGGKVSKILCMALAFSVAALSFSGCRGCRKKNQSPPEEQGSIFQDAGMSGPQDPRHGSQGAITVETPPAKGTGVDSPRTTTAEKRTYKNCLNPKPVTQGDLKTPEGTLYKAFECLLTPDTERAFECFAGYVDSNYQRRDHVRRYWFAAARKDNGRHFKRLVYGPKNPSYVICEKRPEGKTAIRIFVGKSPPVGSNPPMVLHKVSEQWLLKSFTPH
jgi:hypothetical protein